MLVKLNDVAKIVTGGTPSTENDAFWNGGNIPWLQSGCCQNCYVEKAEKYITQLGYKSCSAKLMPKDTIMIALTGATAGKVGYLCFEACGNQSITGITPIKGKLLPKYLYYFLIQRRYKTISDCIGGAQPHISQAYVKNIEIPLRDVEEQQKIVKLLNIISVAIRNAETQLKLYDEMIKSRFIEMFGDPIENTKRLQTRKLRDVVSFTRANEIEGDETYWSLNLDMIETNTGRIIKKLMLPKSKIGSSTFFFNANYVLYSKLRPYLNKVVTPNNYGYATTELVPMLPSKEINKIYLAYLLRSKEFVKWINSTCYGAKMPRASIDELKNYYIPIPSIQEQVEFENFVNEIDKSKFVILNIFYEKV